MNPLFDYIRTSLTPVYGPEEARELAFWILEEEAGLSRSDVLACKDTKNISNIEIILQKLLKKEPIQYIFGHTAWLGLDLNVTRNTLIPRPETAELVEWIEGDRLRVLDIGTGSGCIAIALKKRHPDWHVTGLDISAEALQVARSNALKNQVEADWIQADILADVPHGKWDVIVSNPPYICEEEKVLMDTNVLDYEPATALFVPNEDPLLFYRRIAQLKLGKQLYFEINERFGQQVCEMLDFNGYFDIELKRDCYGKERMVRARIEG